MALAFTKLANYLSRLTNLPTITAFSMMAWVKQPYLVAQYQGMLCFGKNDGSTNWYYAGTLGDGVQGQLYNSNLQGQGSNFIIQKWTHLAMTVAGSGASQAKMYRDGVVDVTADGSATITADIMLLGRDAYSSPENSIILMENALVYSAAVSQADIQAQMILKPWDTPARSANLNSWSPLEFDAKDYSGNGYDWTVNGAPTYHQGMFSRPKTGLKSFPLQAMRR